MVSGNPILPNFLVIGAQRTATSWLYACLKEHPQVYLPHVKEIHYFDLYYEKGIEAYKRYYRFWAGEKAVGDITPCYLYKKGVAERIAEELPEARLIVTLRNPAERAFSQYKMYRRNGLIRTDFETTLAEEPEYIGRGYYYAQLQPYLKLFPREKILILIYEELKKDPRGHLKKVFSFLNVRDDFDPSLSDENLPSEGLVGGLQVPASKIAHLMRRSGLGFMVDAYTRSRASLLTDWIFNKFRPSKHEARRLSRSGPESAMKEDTRLDLNRLFREDKEKLEALLGRDLGFWS